ncbi:DNA-methyltransferase Dcm [Actinobacteria bacterium IMCC26256]|nr:DNA-methyltransferase Dcm [Actinobacteria bacterium IMCC26256]
MAWVFYKSIESDDWLTQAGSKVIFIKPSPAPTDSTAILTPGAHSPFSFIDLFAGIGGFHLGMVANGGVCRFSNEWNKYAAITYKAWTGCLDSLDGGNFFGGDIRLLVEDGVIPTVDVLCAGFPCQPFSLAGVSKKNSLKRPHGFLDAEQGNLFDAICEIAAATKPRVLFLENVKNLKSHDKGQTWRVITEKLDHLGYELKHEVIDAAGWVPQHRERVFMVAFRRGVIEPSEIASFHFPDYPRKRPKLGSILEKDPDKKYMLSDNLWAYLQAYAEKHRKLGNGFGFGLVGPEDISRTMSARYHKDGSEILIDQPDWKNPRRLTPNEAAKLMGFNSKFAKLMGHGTEFPIVVSDTQAYRQFGNSVSPIVVEAVGAEIARVLQMRLDRLSAKRDRKHQARATVPKQKQQ